MNRCICLQSVDARLTIDLAKSRADEVLEKLIDNVSGQRPVQIKHLLDTALPPVRKVLRKANMTKVVKRLDDLVGLTSHAALTRPNDTDFADVVTDDIQRMCNALFGRNAIHETLGK
jgi:hypothetical protein